MKEKFYNYFSDIVISEVTKGRIEQIYNEIKDLYNNIGIDDVLLCDVINNGNKDYINLWFFGQNAAIECKDFMNKDDFDLAIIDENITYFNIKKWNYVTTEEPNDNSSVVIDATLNSGRISCNLMATGKNCKYVTMIAKKYLIVAVQK